MPDACASATNESSSTATPAPPPIELGVNGCGRPEEHERLIDQVAAQIVEQAAGFLRRAFLPPGPPRFRTPALESRLEAVHLAERPVGQ